MYVLLVELCQVVKDANMFLLAVRWKCSCSSLSLRCGGGI